MHHHWRERCSMLGKQFSRRAGHWLDRRIRTLAGSSQCSRAQWRSQHIGWSPPHVRDCRGRHGSVLGQQSKRRRVGQRNVRQLCYASRGFWALKSRIQVATLVYKIEIRSDSSLLRHSWCPVSPSCQSTLRPSVLLDTNRESVLNNNRFDLPLGVRRCSHPCVKRRDPADRGSTLA
jgi:hypothetical protein